MKTYYQHKGITIYHADCREILPEIKADVMVTDPPYGLGFPYLSYEDTRENLMQIISFLSPYLVDSNYLCYRSVVTCGPTQIGLYPQATWVSAITWNTTGSFGAYGYSQWMPVLLYGNDLKGFGNVNGITKSDTKRILGGGCVGFCRDVNEKKHTCPKPFNIMKWIVQRFSESTCCVVDPLMGSGTTLVAAKDLGRKAIGIELEEKYCEIAAKRLAQEVLF